MGYSQTIEKIISSPCGHLNGHLKIKQPKKNKIVKPRNDCPEVIKMHWDLKYWCLENGIRFEKEYQFHWHDKTKAEIKELQARLGVKRKKYRFDFCLPDKMIGIEYNGVNCEKSGHTTLVGHTKDCEKYNLAINEGWVILTYTVLNYQNLIQDVSKLWEIK